MSDITSLIDLPVDPTDDDDIAVGNDIRLLGRLLGDAIERTDGTAVLELVEQVRQIAVDARRSERSAVDDIRSALAEHPLDAQILVVRALDWLSLLANTAEDVHLERRRRQHRRRDAPSQPGSIDALLARVREAGVSPDDLVAAVESLQVSPVITAHPTEVRRKTILEVLDQLTDLLDELDLRRDDAAAVAEIEHELSVCVLLLWQTALLRLSKLRVRDEINEAIRYYDSSLFDVIPALTHDLATGTAAVADGRCVDTSGCDHDGVVDRRRPRRQPVRHGRRRALRHRTPGRNGARASISRALYGLSRRLSMTDRLVTADRRSARARRRVG